MMPGRGAAGATWGFLRVIFFASLPAMLDILVPSAGWALVCV